MSQNKYDDPHFFTEYSKMPRSIHGLDAAGEWSVFKTHMPALKDKKVLDLGCGYGWHCQFAAEQGARSVIGIDLSAKMLEKARQLTSAKNVDYQQAAIEDFAADTASFDVIISSLALHYIQNLETVFENAARLLVPQGELYYSAEHPIFTVRAQQDWIYAADQQPIYWPVDHYFEEGKRETHFLDANVVKYHRTIETHVMALIKAGFEITALIEPTPPSEMIKKMGWENELRRPMMLIIKAKKKELIV
ncbi:class I SAM-dependent methyltransferase [Acinetobacter sp. NIPH 1958]|uniref:class I SAM-dependent methyltransferase n=1 Tax=unclassified Acinetobacter TaxID=196816 RepID=UPI001F4A9D13|nr:MULTISPECIES: class I SAM-dependent methyltransferase [unclassified Acinetobacter]MCH7352217.1 class I SAM-dependent methyltransferase [Acinetobacter sp. NIPH 2023]MCH7355664.1 class I SAM-dependent methyltransferase [Acinetobacter sp. NIPH 1958]MCH7358184.1 class I SAM-dependent methyltransferase [Acinetobacter sp. NIPH 2024]